MKNTVWLLQETIIAIHHRQIAEHGGSEGLRDEGLLSSALARPQNLFAYGQPTPDFHGFCTDGYRSVFIRAIRGQFLDAPKKQQNQYNQKDEPDTAAGPISPTSAIGPRWDCAN